MMIRRWAPAIAWAAVILLGTSIPGEAVPPGPAGVDKVAHFGAYALLGLLAIRAASPNRKAPMRVMAMTLAAVATFAAVDEWHQGFILGRYPDSADWVADVAGATVGIGSMALFTLRRSARS